LHRDTDVFLKKKNNAILSATFLDKGVVLDCVEGCRQILAKKKKEKKQRRRQWADR